MRAQTLIFLMLWMVLEHARSAPRARREMDQLLKESDFAAIEEMDVKDTLDIGSDKFTVDEMTLNAGRQVKMDDYEILKNRNRILKTGNVDLLVDLIEEEMEASEKWNKIEVNSFPVADELHLVDNDLEIYKEMMNKVNFLEKQMRKPKNQHVAVKPFDKNIKIVKSQFLKLDNKLDGNTINFVEEFLVRGDQFVKDAQVRFHEGLNSKTEEDVIKVTMYNNIDELLEDNSKEAVEENSIRHYHPKFKYYWNKETEESHQHHHPLDESDSVTKSSISNSWFGWSLDMLALVAFLLILAVLIIGKLTLCKSKGSFHKVSKC